MHTTLYSFCNEYKLARSSVHDFCKKHKIDTEFGLNDEAQKKIAERFGISLNTPTPVKAPEAVKTVRLEDMQIQDTAMPAVNTSQIVLPASFSASEMVKRFDGVVGQATQPDTILALTKAVIGTGLQTMNEKLEAQRIQLLEHEKALKQAQQIASEGFVDMKVKALEIKMLAEKQTDTTAELQELLGKLLNMGTSPQEAPQEAVIQNQESGQQSPS